MAKQTDYGKTLYTYVKLFLNTNLRIRNTDATFRLVPLLFT